MSNPVSLTCSVPQGSVIGKQNLVAYTEDIVVETIEVFMVKHHLYADDTQLQNHMRLAAIKANCRKMEQGGAAINDWCSSRRLQMNADKTDVMWFGFRVNMKKISQMDSKLHLGSIVEELVTSVQNLEVYIDGKLTCGSISEESRLPVSTICVVSVPFETSCPQLQCSVSYLHLFSLD